MAPARTDVPDVAEPHHVHDAKGDRVFDEEGGEVVAVLPVRALRGAVEAARMGGEVTGAPLGVLPLVARTEAGHEAGEARLLGLLHRPQRARGDAAGGGGVVDGAP